ncbi:hypothetical protein F383_22489 [Gossypium arboreum]|uniref:Uncharacterized protein n=1 Tax=Gossypium arboreum TaxID=29729 RepID=A0A0B0NYP6_GOSAR|nr:hypothetical protein F383_22489 [Gossypium arboreum]
MMIKLVNFYHFRSRNTKSRPRPGKGQASRRKPISRPRFVYRGSYSKLMRYESSYVSLMCHRASIGDQGTSEASITLSPEALVGVSKGGKKAW